MLWAVKRSNVFTSWTTQVRNDLATNLHVFISGSEEMPRQRIELAIPIAFDTRTMAGITKIEAQQLHVIFQPLLLSFHLD